MTKPQPDYPEFAKEAGIRGTVVLHVLVGRDGRVHDAKVIRSIKGLDGTAVNGVRKWIFKPALSNGKPVQVWIEISMNSDDWN